jgi:hypothetical protein
MKQAQDQFPDIAIYPSVWRVLVNVVLYAGFIFTGLALVTFPETLYRLIGAGVTVYFGLLESYAIFRLVRRAPSLVVGVDGIHDNSSIIAAGRIGWDEVCAIERKKNYLVHHISVTLADKDAVVWRIGLPRRWLVQIMQTLSEKAIALPPGFLNTPLNEVELLLQRYFAEFGNR